MIDYERDPETWEEACAYDEEWTDHRLHVGHGTQCPPTSKTDSWCAYYLYSLGCPDDETGESCDGRWYGLFQAERAILSEDSQGFLDLDVFDTEEELEDAWNLCLDETNEEDEEADNAEEV